ncbi:cobyrinate a,c-diamide synthase [Tenacibaculum amylolyticum]|uniref:cobyrinate a,c-diamide synthase n=1 Tax=Tenacibaculum amylolyticum TaxID=104269 RepID=UPI003893C4BA
MSNAFLIAAPWSNSGKTTVTLGLARYFSNKNYKVQTFKCGPDYIDTIHHSRAAKSPSINLDSVLMSDAHIQDVFRKYSSASDITIVEGVMGLFDGAVKDQGSSAELAKKLDIPVILVVNAKAMAYTIAPILHGLRTFDPEVKIAGVLFNFVKTESHYAFLKEACETVGIPSLGYIPPNEDIKIPSRHLGLHIEDKFEELIEKAAEHVGGHAKTEKLLELTQRNTSNGIHPIYQITESFIKKESDKYLAKGMNPLEKRSLKIAIAKDEAFTFTYVENLAYLKQIGEVVFFSPIHDTKLPEADIIYLAGGYPELYLEQLSKNVEMKKAIKKAVDTGVKILAECGGMMYLGNQIINNEGKPFDMVGVFDFSTTMEQKKLHLGYRKVVFEDETLLGHEFHYSSILEDHYASIAEVYTARDREIETKVYSYKNVLASYIHLYWGEGNFSWLSRTKRIHPLAKEAEDKTDDVHLTNGTYPIAKKTIDRKDDEQLNNGMNPLGEEEIEKTVEPYTTNGIYPIENSVEEEYYFVTFATAKSRISDRMVKFNTRSFIRNLEALTFEQSDIEKMMELFKEAFKRYEIDVVCFNILPDHVHLLLKVEDEKELITQIKNLKGYTSFSYQRYKEWEKEAQKVWAQKFHRKRISKVDNSIEKVTNYIKNNHYKHEARWGEEMSTFIESLHSQEEEK